MRRSAAEM